MKEQLIGLARLHRLDSKVFSLRRKRDDIRTLVEDIEQSLKALQDNLNRQTEALEESAVLRRDQEMELTTKQDLIGRAKAKMAAVNNTKQYMAAEREMESARRDMTMVQSQVLQLMDTEEQGKVDLAERQERLDTLTTEMTEKRESLEVDIVSLDSRLEQQTEGRDTLVSAIDRQLLSRYNLIAGRLNGAAMAAADEDGTCSGCNMQVRPMVYNQLHVGDTLHMCAHCKRILYLESWLGPDTDPPPASEDSAAEVGAEA